MIRSFHLEIPCALALAAALLAAPSAGIAAPADSARADTAHVLIEGLEVFGTRPVATRGGSSEIQASIDSLQIPAGAGADRVLRSLPGVHVRTNSRGEAELSVRGSESRQVAVLFDGMPLTLSWDGRTDLSVIPIGALQQVTLVRGLSTLLAGPNVLGGVVEFQSGAAGGGAIAPSASIRSGVDHVGGFGTSAAITAPRTFDSARLTVRAGIGHRDTPGAPLASGVVEPLPDGELRRNTDLSETDAFASARLDREGGEWLSLATAAFRAERGIAAELDAASPRFWRYPHIARALTVLSGGSGVRNTPWGGRTSLQGSFGVDAGRSEIDAYGSRTYETIVSEEDGDQRTLSMRVTGSQTFGRRGDLKVGVTSGDLTFDEHLTPGTTSRYRQRLWSVAGESMLRFPAAHGGILDEFDVSLGAAFDRSTYPLTGGKPGLDPRNEWGGRAGLSALFDDGKLSLHASANRRARFPSLRELYSGAIGRFDPNPGLVPERLVAFEAGVTLRDSHGTLQLVGFHQRLSGAVVRVRVGSLFRRVNQEGLRSAGAELAGSRRLGWLTLGAGLVGQSVRLLDPAASTVRPENLPEWSGSLHAEAALPRRFRISAEARYTGEQFAIHPNTGDLATLPARVRIDVEFSRAWRVVQGDGWFSTLHTRIAAENLSDMAIYDAFGLPEPGRTFRFDVRLH
jgi:iron complex outermembrane receptor protein